MYCNNNHVFIIAKFIYHYRYHQYFLILRRRPTGNGKAIQARIADDLFPIISPSVTFIFPFYSILTFAKL